MSLTSHDRRGNVRHPHHQRQGNNGGQGKHQATRSESVESDEDVEPSATYQDKLEMDRNDFDRYLERHHFYVDRKKHSRPQPELESSDFDEDEYSTSPQKQKSKHLRKKEQMNVKQLTRRSGKTDEADEENSPDVLPVQRGFMPGKKKKNDSKASKSKKEATKTSATKASQPGSPGGGPSPPKPPTKKSRLSRKWSVDVNGFKSTRIRHRFTSRVFMILMCQLILIAGMCCPFVFIEGLQKFCEENWWLSVVFLVPSVLLLLCLACGPMELCMKKVPFNKGMLFLHTIFFALFVGVLAGCAKTSSPRMTFIICYGLAALFCFIVILFCLQTCSDIMTCRGMALLCLFSIMIIGFVAAMLMITMDSDILEAWHLGVGVVFVLLYAGYLLLDLQLIFAGKCHQYEIPPDQYFFGAIVFHVDLIMIFSYIVDSCIGIS